MPSELAINGLAYCPQREIFIKTTEPKSFSLSLSHRCLYIYLKRGRGKIRQKIQFGKQVNKISALLSILSKCPKERHNHHHFEKKSIYYVTSRKEICYHSWLTMLGFKGLWQTMMRFCYTALHRTYNNLKYFQLHNQKCYHLK